MSQGVYCCSLSQGRCKERLFEEEMEVVWEKGGSGLVFYTDASHWDQLEGGKFAFCSAIIFVLIVVTVCVVVFIILLFQK